MVVLLARCWKFIFSEVVMDPLRVLERLMYGLPGSMLGIHEPWKHLLLLITSILDLIALEILL